MGSVSKLRGCHRNELCIEKIIPDDGDWSHLELFPSINKDGFIWGWAELGGEKYLVPLHVFLFVIGI